MEGAAALEDEEEDEEEDENDDGDDEENGALESGSKGLAVARACEVTFARFESLAKSEGMDSLKSLMEHVL